MPAYSRRVFATVAAALTLLLALPIPVGAADTNQLDERSNTTYRVLPGEKTLRTQIDFTLVARKKPTYRVGPCKGNRSRTCRTRTNYYWVKWSDIYVPAGATNIRATGKGVKARPVREATDGGGIYGVTFPRLDFKEKQTFSFGYDIPAGDPETNAPTRIGDAYAHFCWYGPYTDTGSVRAILPPGWEAITYGTQPKVTASATATILESPGKRDPGDFFVCTEAFHPVDMARDHVLSPGGSLVTVEGWPEDALWAATMVEEIDVTLPLLEELIGSPMPLREVVLREASTQALRWRTGDLYPTNGVIRMSEDIGSLGAATSRLARTWFTESTVGDPWLREGLSLWTAFSTVETACPEPVTSPAAGLPGLRDWMTPEGAGAAYDPAVANDQASVACGMVAEVAQAIGPERMTDVISSLLVGPEPADWRDWLTAVEVRGLIPAGADDPGLAERQLLDHGIATPAELSGRTSAMEVYAETLAQMDGTRLPTYVDRLMADWLFPEALLGVADAKRIYRVIVDHPAMADADRMAFLAALEAADAPEALMALAASVEADAPPPTLPESEPTPIESVAAG
jgi:hypothetical protein